jgi:hypothetical protein
MNCRIGNPAWPTLHDKFNIRLEMFIIIILGFLEQEILSLPEQLSSTPVLSGVRITRSLVLCVVFCRSLFVPLTFSNTTVTNTKRTKKEKNMIYNTTQKTGWIYVLRNGKHRTKIFRSMSSLRGLLLRLTQHSCHQQSLVKSVAWILVSTLRSKSEHVDTLLAI